MVSFSRSALAWPFRALARRFPEKEESMAEWNARRKREKETHKRRERRLKTIGGFFWTLLWPVRFIVRSLVRFAAFILVPMGMFLYKFGDEILGAIFILALLGGVVGFIYVSIVLALEDGWWMGLLPSGVFLVIAAPFLFLALALDNSRRAKKIGRVFSWPFRVFWGFLKLCWVILVAVKYRLCPLVRVE